MTRGLSGLQTTAKETLVDAINEHNSKIVILQQNMPSVFPASYVVKFDAITVGNFVLPWNPIQLGTVTLA